MKKTILFIFLAMSLVACRQEVENARVVDKLPVLFPDDIGVTIPSTIAPMNFSVEGDVEIVDVVARGSKGGEMHVQGDYADFDIDDWHALVARNKGGKLTFTVCTKNDGVWTRYREFDMYVSNYHMTEYGLN